MTSQCDPEPVQDSGFIFTKLPVGLALPQGVIICDIEAGLNTFSEFSHIIRYDVSLPG